MIAQYGQYIYMAAILALGLGIAIYARYDYRKRRTKSIEDEKDKSFGALAFRLNAQTEPLDQLRHASPENRTLTNEEKIALHDAIRQKAAQLETLYGNLPVGRYKALALTDLESSAMWIAKALET